MSEKRIPVMRSYSPRDGYIVYESNVMPGLVCRVYDAIQTVDDYEINQADGWQYTAEGGASKIDFDAVKENINELIEEATSVSRAHRRVLARVIEEGPKEGKTDSWMEKCRSISALVIERKRIWASFGMTVKKFKKKIKPRS